MTDQSNPSAPKSPRKKSDRQPATIDAKAREVKAAEAESGPETNPAAREAELARQAVAAEMAAPESAPAKEPVKASASPTGPVAGRASMGPADQAVPLNEPPKASETTGKASRGRVEDRSVPPPEPPDSRRGAGSAAPVIAAALLGGVVGAGLLFAVENYLAPPDDSRLDALEQRVSSLPQGGAATSAVQALAARVQALEIARTASEQRLASVQEAAEKALDRPVPAPGAPDAAALGDLERRLSEAETQFTAGRQDAASIRDALAAQGQDAAAARAALAGQVKALENQISQGPDATTKAAARLVLAQNLGQALRMGQPYGPTLAALRANGMDEARVAALAPFAEKGAPTAAALAESFKTASSAILRDERAASGSIADRLLRMADRVVTIRPVDEPGSTNVGSLVARIDAALSRGDVREAVAVWETLPEPARRLSEEWAARARARAAADASADALVNAAVAALAQPPQ